MTDCEKCGTIEGTSTHPALDVAVCQVHGEQLFVHVASDPRPSGHGHHRECLRCLVDELYKSRDVAEIFGWEGGKVGS